MNVSFISSAFAWKDIKDYWKMELNNACHTIQYNIQPGDMITAITIKDDKWQMNKVKWGFTSSTNTSDILLSNARREGIFSQRSFRFSIRNNRCLIPIDSYYTVKQSFYDGQSAFRILPINENPQMALGLLSEDGTCCALVTRASSSSILDVSEREPIYIDINEEADINSWLKTNEMKEVDRIMNHNNKEPQYFYVITNDITTNVNSPILHKACHKDLNLFD